ncbi:MAG: hypothetical protein Q9165_007986 [Trypethelium subeluteriae]
MAAIGWTFVGPQDEFEPAYSGQFIIVAYLNAIAGNPLDDNHRVPIIAYAPDPTGVFELQPLFWDNNTFVQGRQGAWSAFAWAHNEHIINVHNTDIDWLDDFAVVNGNGTKTGDAEKIQAALDQARGISA